MPQNGIHAMVGVVARRWLPKKEWLLLGMVLGNMFPDLDIFVVAFATLAKLPEPDQYHRTFTHSLFTTLALLLLFYILAAATRNDKWKNFGNGFAIGIVMHIALDLVLWFNGVELLWPIRYELNFWSWFAMPAWLKIILDTGEFLAFGCYFLVLVSLARQHDTDAAQQPVLRTWAYVEFALSVLFTILLFALGTKGWQYSLYGLFYLVSITAAMLLTVRMKRTVELLSS